MDSRCSKRQGIQGVLFSEERSRQALSVATLAYAAGLVDGEGCITITRKKPGRDRISPRYDLVVTVGNTNPVMTEFLHEQFGGSVSDYKRASRPKEKRLYQWVLQANQAASFLELILPHLLIKKKQAELAIDFQRNKRVLGKGLLTADWLERYHDYHKQMKELNNQ